MIKVGQKTQRIFRAAGVSDDEEDDDDLYGFGQSTSSRPKPRWMDENQRSQTTNYFEQFSKAINLGNLEETADAIEKIAPPLTLDSIFSGGWNGLMNACHFGFVDIVKFLLKKGANPNFSNDLLFTPLMAGCSSFQDKEKHILECIQLLVKNDANINFHDEHGMTPLMFACKSGYPSFVQFLIECNANLDLKDLQGWTALFWAVNEGKLVEVEILLKAGAKKKKKDVRGRTAFDLASGRERLKPIAALLCPRRLRDSYYPKNPECDDSDLEDDIEELNQLVKKSASEMKIDVTGRNISKETCSHLDIPTFLTVTDEELLKMGIKYPWHRTQTLEYIKGFHLQMWKKQSEANSENDKKTICLSGTAVKRENLTYATLTRYLVEMEARLSVFQATLAYVNQQCPLSRMCGTDEEQETFPKKMCIYLAIIKKEYSTLLDILASMKEDSAVNSKVEVAPPDLVARKKSSWSHLLGLCPATLVSIVGICSVASILLWKNQKWTFLSFGKIH